MATLTILKRIQPVGKIESVSSWTSNTIIGVNNRLNTNCERKSMSKKKIENIKKVKRDVKEIKEVKNSYFFVLKKALNCEKHFKVQVKVLQNPWTVRIGVAQVI